VIGEIVVLNKNAATEVYMGFNMALVPLGLLPVPEVEVNVE